MAKRIKHVHKYHKIPLSHHNVWACALPNCNHYMPKHLEAAVEGKMSLCWQCDKEFILDEHSMQIDKPICRDCSGSKQHISDYLASLGVE